MATKQQYLNFLKSYFQNETVEMQKENHARHLLNPTYWDHLINPKAESILDFGCGCGRNLLMLQKTHPKAKIYGVDISKNNLDVCQQLADLWNYKIETKENLGNDIPFEDNRFDRIISTITLQHIASHEIRFDILTDMYRTLKKGGKIALQLGFGEGHPSTVDYYSNQFDAQTTNSGLDVKITDPDHLIKDLKKIGFQDVKYTITPSFSDRHQNWIYVTGTK